MEYQHKILRKYTLSGLITYYDASFFHDMVSKRDYKMISIFEVFAVNRNEEDFLENLFIFKDLVNEEQAALAQQTVAQEESAKLQAAEEEQYPNVKVLNQFREGIDEEVYQWCRESLKAQPPQKHLTDAFNCWRAVKDDRDLVHSLKTIFKRFSGR